LKSNHNPTERSGQSESLQKRRDPSCVVINLSEILLCTSHRSISTRGRHAHQSYHRIVNSDREEAYDAACVDTPPLGHSGDRPTGTYTKTTISGCAMATEVAVSKDLRHACLCLSLTSQGSQKFQVQQRLRTMCHCDDWHPLRSTSLVGHTPTMII
jgi:hypothetical protein